MKSQFAKKHQAARIKFPFPSHFYNVYLSNETKGHLVSGEAPGHIDRGQDGEVEEGEAQPSLSHRVGGVGPPAREERGQLLTAAQTGRTGGDFS